MKVAALVVSIMFSSILSAGDIYVWTDENGVKQFSQRPPEHLSDQNSVEKKEINESRAKVSSESRTATPISNEAESAALREKATMDNINNYYRNRVKGCKKHYKSGSQLRKNCIQEQEEIKQDKINKYVKNKF